MDRNCPMLVVTIALAVATAFIVSCAAPPVRPDTQRAEAAQPPQVVQHDTPVILSPSSGIEVPNGPCPGKEYDGCCPGP